MKIIKVGLIKGRHELPVGNYIFDGEIDPMDFDNLGQIAEEWVKNHTKRLDTVVLYVTGLTAATLAVVNACDTYGRRLVCMHFDRETNVYFPQVVL